MESNLSNKAVTEETYIQCPTCQGTGFLDIHKKTTLSSQLNFPMINGDVKEKYKISKKVQKFVKESVFPSAYERKASKEINFQDLSSIMDNFFDEPKEIQNPSETLKLSLQKLKEDNYENNIIAFDNILSLSKSHPELVEPIMKIVYRKLSSLLQNSRSQIVSSAAQIAAALFENMKYAHQPEFDELAGVILQKTANMNKSVKEVANKALDSMILNIPPCHCVRVLTSYRGAGHKNPEVRAAVSRVLESTLKSIGEINLLLSPNLRDVRCKIFVTLAKFLIDGSSETRLHARKLIKILLSHSEFEECFYQDIDQLLFKKIEKTFISLKYNE